MLTVLHSVFFSASCVFIRLLYKKVLPLEYPSCFILFGLKYTVVPASTDLVIHTLAPITQPSPNYGITTKNCRIGIDNNVITKYLDDVLYPLQAHHSHQP